MGYEALGRATKDEYVESRNIMDKFLGRNSVFKPAVIIVDDKAGAFAPAIFCSVVFLQKSGLLN